MSTHSSSLEFLLQRLRKIRTVLLPLHKALLESERVTYEQFNGRILSKREYFQLVVGDEWFSWLRPLSQLIAQIDETLSSKQPVTLEQVNQLLEEVQKLLQPSEQGTTLEKRYYRAIQRDPDVALMHSEVSRLLKAES
jgi:hypothetical protein